MWRWGIQVSSPASVIMVNIPLRATRLASEGLRYPSGRSVLQKLDRGFSFLVFDLLPAMASTISYR
jgi:hypothetical protein